MESAELVKFVTTDDASFSCMALYSNGELYGLGYNGSHLMGTSVNSYAVWTLLRTDVANIWCGSYGSTILTLDKKILYSGYLQPFGGTGTSASWVDYTSRYTAIIKDTDLLQDMQNDYYGVSFLYNGSVYYMGSNRGNQFGNAAFNTSSFLLVRQGVKKYIQGYSNSFLLTTSNTLYVCGSNSYGQLGTGSTTSISSYALSSLTDLLDIAVNQECTYVLRSDGTVFGVGSQVNGQLGNNVSTGYSTTWAGVYGAVQPNQVKLYSSQCNYSVPTRTSIVIDDAGLTKLLRSGENDYGQIGNGNNTNVASFTNAVVPGAGAIDMCAVRPRSTFVVSNKKLYGCGELHAGLGTFTQNKSSVMVELKLPL